MALLAIRKLGRMTAAPTEKVISAEDYQRLLDSKQAIVRIEEEARVLYEETREEARRTADAEAEKTAGERMLRTSHAVVDYLSRVENKLIAIVTESVKKIIGDVDGIEAASGLVRNALHAMRNESRVTLYVAPAQADGIGKRLDSIMADYPNIGYADLVADPAVASGACRVESQVGTVNLSIDQAVALLEHTLGSKFDTTADVD